MQRKVNVFIASIAHSSPRRDATNTDADSKASPSILSTMRNFNYAILRCAAPRRMTTFCVRCVPSGDQSTANGRRGKIKKQIEIIK